jgi:hypothetical protein
MPIVTSTQPGSFVVPGTYIDIVPPPPVSAPGPNTSLIGIVGTASYGPLNAPTNFNLATIYTTFGRSTQNLTTSSPPPYQSTIVDAVLNGMTPESNAFIGVRVADGSQAAASVSIIDNAGYATGTITISGTAGTGQTLFATFTNGALPAVVTTTYAIPTGQSAAATATAFSAVLNNCAAFFGSNAFMTTSAASGNTIPLVAWLSGTGGNSITFSATISGSGQTVSPTATTSLTGGAAPGVLGLLTDVYTGSYSNSNLTNNVVSGYRMDLVTVSGSTSPIYRLTLYHPDAPAQVFNVNAYATVGGGYSATAFRANLAAAINVGSSSAGPAVSWTYSNSGSSTATPLIGFYQGAAGGVDGDAAITTQTLIGQDSSTGAQRTGLYALRTYVPAAQVVIPQLYDLTAAQTLATFAVQENCIAFIDLGPPGTTVTSALSGMAANAVHSSSLVASMEWCNYLDPYSGTVKLCSPSNTISGIVSSLSPWFSPLNKPTGGKGGLISTEWSTTVFPDFTSLETGNICFIALEYGNFVQWNDNCSDGTPIADARMRNYISYQLQVIAAPFIGQLQSSATNDPTRAAYFGAIRSFLSPMAPAPYGSATTPQINAFIIDTSGNTPTSIQQGFLIGKITVQTLRGIRYVLNILLVGSQVVVQTANT